VNINIVEPMPTGQSFAPFPVDRPAGGGALRLRPVALGG
jgi:hypothetical protein